MSVMTRSMITAMAHANQKMLTNMNGPPSLKKPTIPSRNPPCLAGSAFNTTSRRWCTMKSLSKNQLMKRREFLSRAALGVNKRLCTGSNALDAPSPVADHEARHLELEERGRRPRPSPSRGRS